MNVSRVNEFQTFYNARQTLEQKCLPNQPSSLLPQHEKEENPHLKKAVLGAAFLGAVVPVIISNIKKGKLNILKDTFKNETSGFKDKFKSCFEMFEIENVGEIFASNACAVGLGTLTGAKLSKTSEEKNARYKEGTFEFLNGTIPTLLTGGIEKFSKETGKIKTVPQKAVAIAASVLGGMFIANKASNKINEKVFDKDKEIKEKRNFRPADCLVHADDLLGLFVLAKVPFAKFIQADKILPLLYTRAGFEAGTKRAKEDSAV